MLSDAEPQGATARVRPEHRHDGLAHCTPGRANPHSQAAMPPPLFQTRPDVESIWGEAGGPANHTSTIPPAPVDDAPESHIKRMSTRVTFKKVIHRDAVSQGKEGHKLHRAADQSNTGPACP